VTIVLHQCICSLQCSNKITRYGKTPSSSPLPLNNKQHTVAEHTVSSEANVFGTLFKRQNGIRLVVFSITRIGKMCIMYTQSSRLCYSNNRHLYICILLLLSVQWFQSPLTRQAMLSMQICLHSFMQDIQRELFQSNLWITMVSVVRSNYYYWVKTQVNVFSYSSLLQVGAVTPNYKMHRAMCTKIWYDTRTRYGERYPTVHCSHTYFASTRFLSKEFWK